MTYETAQRLTASLPPNIATFIDEYQKRTGASKSDIIVQGIRALQEKLLAEEYAAMAREQDPIYAIVLNDLTDGLEPSDGEQWQ